EGLCSISMSSSRMKGGTTTHSSLTNVSFCVCYYRGGTMYAPKHFTLDNAAGIACRCGGRQPPAPAAIRIYSPARGWNLYVLAAWAARDPQGGADRPPRDGPGGRAGAVDASTPAGRAVAGFRSVCCLWTGARPLAGPA